MKKRKREAFKTCDIEDVIQDLRSTPKGERACLGALKERREAWVQHWLKVHQRRLRLRLRRRKRKPQGLAAKQLDTLIKRLVSKDQLIRLRESAGDSGEKQRVRWNPELSLRKLGVPKKDWQRAMTATGIKLANRKLCATIRKRLLRRWKGTPLEVRTTAQMEKVYTRDVRLMQPHPKITWARPISFDVGVATINTSH